MKQTQKTLRSGQKAEQAAAVPDSWNNAVVSSPGFSFCLIYSRVEAEEANDQAMPMGAGRRTPAKASLSRKGAA